MTVEPIICLSWNFLRQITIPISPDTIEEDTVSNISPPRSQLNILPPITPRAPGEEEYDSADEEYEYPVGSN